MCAYVLRHATVLGERQHLERCPHFRRILREGASISSDGTYHVVSLMYEDNTSH